MNDFDSVRFVDLAIASSVKAAAEDAARNLDLYRQLSDATPEHIYAIETENIGRRKAVQFLYKELKAKLNILTDLEKVYNDEYNECMKGLTSKKK